MGLFASFFYDDGKVFPPDPKVPLDDAGRFFGRCHIRKEEADPKGLVSFFI